MRTPVVVVAIVLGLAVTGCTAAKHPAAVHPRARANHRPRAGSQTPLSAQVLLPSRTITAGSSMAGHVVIENNTGRAIRTGGCLSLFQVDLVSASYHPEVAWPTCLQFFTIPTGRSSYPVKAAYDHCTQGRPSQGVKRCPRHGMPPLPPGTYRAVLYQSRHLVPVLPALTVQVTPR